MYDVKRIAIKRIPYKTLVSGNLKPRKARMVAEVDTVVDTYMGETYTAILFKPSETKLNQEEVFRELSVFGGVIGLREVKDGMELIDMTGMKHRISGTKNLTSTISYLEQSLIDRFNMTKHADNIYCYSVPSIGEINSLPMALSLISRYHGDYNQDSMYYLGYQFISHLGRFEKALVIKEVSLTGRRLHNRIGLQRHMDYHTMITVGII